jgi:hypothetical protein
VPPLAKIITISETPIAPDWHFHLGQQPSLPQLYKTTIAY